MALKTLYLKEHEGPVHNPIGQLSSVPWWSSFAPNHVSTESCGDQLTATKLAREGAADQQAVAKGNAATRFTMTPGQFKTSDDGEKRHTVISLQTALPEYRTHFDLGGFGQPLICTAKYPLVDQCYGALSTCGTPISGRIMLPMNMATDEGPIYVNAKQYHGIMRRRKSRAKAITQNKLTKNRKPYMHYSRHLHAMRRPRGCGGRFLNTKEQNNAKAKIEAEKSGNSYQSRPTGSQNSEVLQSSASGNMNSPKEASGGGLNLSGSEVTSLYSRGNIDGFPINHLGPPIHSFPGMMESVHGIVMPSKWVAATGNCCNLKK